MYFVGVLAFAEECFVHSEPRLGENRVLEVGAIWFEVFFAAAREGGGVSSGGLALGGKGCLGYDACWGGGGGTF